MSPIDNHCSTYLLFTYPFSTCLMSNPCLLTRSAARQCPSNNDAAPSLPTDSKPQNPPTGKCKHHSKKEMEAARLLQAEEQQMVQDKLQTVNAQIANLEVTCLVDADLPTLLRLTQHTDLFLFFHTLTPLRSHTCSTMTHISHAHDS